VIVTLLIPGKPTGKGRPRFSNGRTYTDPKTATAELRVQAAWQDAGMPRLPDGPVCATIALAVSRPKSHFRTNGLLSTKGEAATRPTSRPDLDNVAKLVLDALNGRAYGDDAQVYDLHAFRYWASPGEGDHTHVTLVAA
jgi:Holliday junction resolvase RusA-like endonuclease